jgi:hypothetical protein
LNNAQGSQPRHPPRLLYRIYRDGRTVSIAITVYLFDVLYVYWQWGRSHRSWWAKGLAGMPALLVVYALFEVSRVLHV